MFEKTKKFVKEEKTVLGAFAVGAAIAGSVTVLLHSNMRMSNTFMNEYLSQTNQIGNYINWLGK